MINVSLFDNVGLCLLIAYPSGVAYATQTGGTLCRQSQIEGVLVPLGNSLQNGCLGGAGVDLARYFEGPPYHGDGAAGGITENDAAFIDSVLRAHGVPSVISVDRSQLADSDESWVHVTIAAEEDREPSFKMFSGLGPYPRSGVLTWPNGD